MSDTVNIKRERALRENDNSILLPADTLRYALDDIESGKTPADSVLILHLDHGDDGTEFNAGWYAANLKSSEMIALMRAIEHRLLTEMGFGD